jgi:hypothetical protein
MASTDGQLVEIHGSCGVSAHMTSMSEEFKTLESLKL